MAHTVGELLRAGTERLRAAGSESVRLDAELLLGHALGLERTSVLAHPEAMVGDGQAATYEASLVRREAGEPVAYIRGIKEFHGLAFLVDARALIPRPETELLVDLAVDGLRELLVEAPRAVDAPSLLAWDVGTGSGAVAIALAVTLRRRRFLDHVRVLGSDVSSEALGLAVENAVAHGVADRVELVAGDLLDVQPPPGPADMLLANLPYIPSATMPTLPVAASFEPPLALDGGADGLDVIRRLLAALPGRLAPDGRALLEIGSDQPAALREACALALPGWRVTIHADLAGEPRVARLDPPGRVG